MWIISISLILTILIGMKGLHKINEPASNFANALWLSQHRNVWAFSIAWIIYACQASTGGIVKWFLELSIWQPLAKMSLSFYLVHTMILTVISGTSRTAIYFSNQYLIQYFAAGFVISVMCSIILYLTFEEPILVIENYIYKKIALRRNLRQNSSL